MSKIIIVSELQQYSLNELQVLYRKVQQEAATCPLGSTEYRNAVASLQNISRVLQAQRVSRLKPPGF